MKNIKVKVLAIMLVMIMALTGCMNVNQEIVINSDGSAKITGVVSVDKQMYVDAMVKVMKKNGVPASKEDIAKELDTAMAKDGSKIVVVDGREYYQQTLEEVVKKGNLQKTFAEGTAASYVTTDTFYVEMAVDKMTSDEVEAFKEVEAMLGDDSFDSIKTVLTVQFPKAVVSSNGIIDKENPNKVSFNVPIDKKVVLFATTKAGVTQDSIRKQIKKLNAVKTPKIKKLKANALKKKAKKASVTLKFARVKGAKKYQVQYSLKKNFKGAKTKTIKKTTYVIKNLKKGKKYFVRVRAAKKNYASVDVYGKWAKKTVRTKK